MKGLLIRFTRWFNRVYSRKGTLWEERFKSVIVESGVAARTMVEDLIQNPETPVISKKIAVKNVRS